MPRSLRKRQILLTFSTLVILLAFLLMLLLGSILNWTKVQSENNAVQILSQAHQQIESRMNDLFDSLERIAYNYNTSALIQDLYQRPVEEMLIWRYDELKTSLSGLYLMAGNVAGVAFFDAEGKCLFSSRYNVFSFSQLPEGYASVTQNTIFGVFDTADTFNALSPSCVLLTPVYSLDSATRHLGARIGTTAFTFYMDSIESMLTSVSAYDGSVFLLCDAGGTPICWNTPDAQPPYTPDRLSSENIACLQASFALSGWTLYSVFPSAVISSDMVPLLQITMSSGLILLLVLIVFLLSLYFLVLRPISSLRAFMLSVPEQADSLRYPEKSENEIGVMIHTMNGMLDAIRSRDEALRCSQQQVLENILARERMEMVAWRSQINPHFLYNTLNCIYGLALYHHTEDIAQISRSLVTVFRYAVKGPEFVTLADELHYTREYFTIIDFRFNHRIHLVEDVPEDVLSCRIFRLSFQPLIENAIFHGMEKKLGEGTITITIRHAPENRLKITVADDGTGMEVEKLEEIRAMIANCQQADMDPPTGSQSVGLGNIARRLFLLYRENGMMSIQSTLDEGTEVSIYIPMQEA